LNRYPHYPAYKPSGINWLGKIPEHWKERQLKYIANVTNSNVDKHTKEDEEPVLLCNYVDVYYNEYITDALDFMKATATEDEKARFQLKEGDVIVTKDSESWNDIAVPAHVSEYIDNLLCGYHLALIRPSSQVYGKYLFRAFQASGINDQFRVAATGITRYGLGKYSLENALFPLPPLEEQRAIAVFLDEQTAVLDNLISEKQALIGLLQEKRAAVISRAVTQGLDTAVALKDSGVDWIGRVPAHWELRRLKLITDFTTSGSRGWAQYYADEGAIFIRIGNLSNASPTLKLSDIQYVQPPTGSEGERTKVQQNDLLISITANIGSVGVVPYQLGETYVNQHVALARPKPNLNNSRWLAYCLLSQVGQEQFSSLLYGGTKDGLSLDDVRNLILLIPPIEEQDTIVTYLDQQQQKLDLLIAETEASIATLQEYRTALIASAVTGQIDVRHAAPK
jgi:type I restriction enzyme, S subunit